VELWPKRIGYNGFIGYVVDPSRKVRCQNVVCCITAFVEIRDQPVAEDEFVIAEADQFHETFFTPRLRIIIDWSRDCPDSSGLSH